MIRLKEKPIISNDKYKIINNDIFIKDGILYISTPYAEYKYEHDSYYIKKSDTQWDSLHGAVPCYDIANNIDDNIFETYEEIIENGAYRYE